MAAKPKMVVVDWIDSMSEQGWRNPSKKVAKCQTVGFLSHRDKECVTVSLSRCFSEDATPWSDSINIPAVAVKKIKFLK